MVIIVGKACCGKIVDIGQRAQHYKYSVLHVYSFSPSLDGIVLHNFLCLKDFSITSFYRCSFDPVHGGQMLQQEYVRFLQTESRPG